MLSMLYVGQVRLLSITQLKWLGVVLDSRLRSQKSSTISSPYLAQSLISLKPKS